MITCISSTRIGILHNPLMPVGNYSYQFFICCPRDCVSRHNGGTRGSPIMPRDISLSDSKCWNGRQKWVNNYYLHPALLRQYLEHGHEGHGEVGELRHAVKEAEAFIRFIIIHIIKHLLINAFRKIWNLHRSLIISYTPNNIRKWAQVNKLEII